MGPSKTHGKSLEPTQDLCALVAQNIIVAYRVHQDLMNKEPYTSVAGKEAETIRENLANSSDDAVKLIKKYNKDLRNIHPIFVLELNLGATADEKELSPTEEALALGCVKAGVGDEASYMLPLPGYVLFGFSATLTRPGNQPLNVLIYRGTATRREAIYDIRGWGDNVPCMLPTVRSTTSGSQNRYGQVQKSLFSFYKDAGVLGFGQSLARSTYDAFSAVHAAQPNTAWAAGAHSLGGAMINLAVLDLLVGKHLSPDQILPVTFGGLVIGDAEFKHNYERKSKNTLRIANMCDFVPAFSDLFPSQSLSPYHQVGTAMGFVWQEGETWRNHSMLDIYWPMVDPKKQFFSRIRLFPVAFPVPVGT